LLDKDGGGSITQDEFAWFLERSSGDRPEKEHIDALISTVDDDGNGDVGFTEFAEIVVAAGSLRRRSSAGEEGGKIAKDLLSGAANLREYFDLIDRDKGGCISHTELVDFLASLGEELGAAQWKLISAMDVDGDGEINFTEFATLLLDPCGENLMRAVGRKITDCHELFALFDFDGGGTIDMPELQHVMSCLGHHPSDSLLEAVIDFSDEDNLGEDTSVGELDFAEFVSLFACGKDGGVNPMAYYVLNRQVIEFKESFGMFHLDAQGRITTESLQQGMAWIMGEAMPRTLPGAIMSHLQSLNGGLNMSFIEFSTMLCLPHTPEESLFRTHLQHVRQAYAVFQRDDTWQVRASTFEAVLGEEACLEYRSEVELVCRTSRVTGRQIFPFGEFCKLWRGRQDAESHARAGLGALLRTRVDELQGVFKAVSQGISCLELSKNRARAVATGEGGGSARGVVTPEALVAAVDRYGGGTRASLAAAESFLQGFLPDVGTGVVGLPEWVAALNAVERGPLPELRSRASRIISWGERRSSHDHASSSSLGPLPLPGGSSLGNQPSFLDAVKTALRFDPEVRPKASIEALRKALVQGLHADFLTQLPPTQLAACCRYLRRHDLGAGEVLYEEGDKGKTLYIVACGSLAVCSYPKEPTPAQAKILAKKAAMTPELLWSCLDPEGKGFLTRAEIKAGVESDEALSHWLGIQEADAIRATFKQVYESYAGGDKGEEREVNEPPPVLERDSFIASLEGAKGKFLKRSVWSDVEARMKRVSGSCEAILAKARDQEPSPGLAELQTLLEQGCHEATQATRATGNGVRHDMDDIFMSDHRAELWFNLSESLKGILSRANAIQYEAYIKLFASQMQPGGRKSWHATQIQLVALCREAVIKLTPEIAALERRFVAGLCDVEPEDSPFAGQFRIAELSAGLCFGNASLLLSQKRAQHAQGQVAKPVTAETLPAEELSFGRVASVYAVEPTVLLTLSNPDYQKALTIEVAQFLGREVDVLRNASLEELQYLAAKAKRLDLHYMSQLCRTGDPTETIYILHRGQLSIQAAPEKIDAGGKRKASKGGVPSAGVEEEEGEHLFTHDKDIEARVEGVPGAETTRHHAPARTVSICNVGPGSLIDMMTEHRTSQGLEYRWAADVVAKEPTTLICLKRHDFYTRVSKRRRRQMSRAQDSRVERLASTRATLRKAESVFRVSSQNQEKTREWEAQWQRRFTDDPKAAEEGGDEGIDDPFERLGEVSENANPSITWVAHQAAAGNPVDPLSHDEIVAACPALPESIRRETTLPHNMAEIVGPPPLLAAPRPPPGPRPSMSRGSQGWVNTLAAPPLRELGPSLRPLTEVTRPLGARTRPIHAKSKPMPPLATEPVSSSFEEVGLHAEVVEPPAAGSLGGEPETAPSVDGSPLAIDSVRAQVRRVIQRKTRVAQAAESREATGAELLRRRGGTDDIFAIREIATYRVLSSRHGSRPPTEPGAPPGSSRRHLRRAFHDKSVFMANQPPAPLHARERIRTAREVRTARELGERQTLGDDAPAAAERPFTAAAEWGAMWGDVAAGFGGEGGASDSNSRAASRANSSAKSARARSLWMDDSTLAKQSQDQFLEDHFPSRWMDGASTSRPSTRGFTSRPSSTASRKGGLPPFNR